MRVLHVLANGPPDVNGYAVRTHNILTTQMATEDVEPIGLTSPWYPDRESMAEPLEIDGMLGVVVELAEITKVEVPTLRALYACVSLLNKTIQDEQVRIKGEPR